MPLPLTVFCFIKMQIGFLPFWYRFTRVVLEKGPLNGCVYVCHVWCKLYLCICRCIIIMEICGVFFICAVLRTKTLSITMQVLSTSCSVLSLFLIVTVLWHCWLGVRKSIWSVKTEWWGVCWCGYLSGARCRWFAYGPADATAIPKPHRLLPHLNPGWFYLSGTGLSRLSWKTGR